MRETRFSVVHTAAQIPSNTAIFLNDVVDEVRRARAKFPVQTSTIMSIALMEEVGELAKEILESKSPKRIWEEAVQVACMALRIASEQESYSILDDRGANT